MKWGLESPTHHHHNPRYIILFICRTPTLSSNLSLKVWWALYAPKAGELLFHDWYFELKFEVELVDIGLENSTNSSLSWNLEMNPKIRGPSLRQRPTGAHHLRDILYSSNSFILTYHASNLAVVLNVWKVALHLGTHKRSTHLFWSTKIASSSSSSIRAWRRWYILGYGGGVQHNNIECKGWVSFVYTTR